MRALLIKLIILGMGLSLYGQEDVAKDSTEFDPVIQTFRDTRVINSHSVETLSKGKLDFRIAHRFGDLAGDAGGWQTFYGLENASDVAIGFEYGVTDKTMIGLTRAKGSGPLRSNLHALLKFKLLEQDANNRNWLSIGVYGIATRSMMEKSPTEGVLHFFEKDAHRMSYHVGFVMARKFSDQISLQLGGSLTYRNIVSSSDKNELPAVNGSLRYHFSRPIALLIDATLPISSLRTAENNYYPAIGIGLEFDTSGGHVFQLNFTNSTGIMETDYIPYTQSNWREGQFRLGFTISRLFTM